MTSAAPTVRHFHGFQVPAHLCQDCGAPVECGYAADRCPGDNYRCTPCTDEQVNHRDNNDLRVHRIRWFARFPGSDEDWTPRTSKMRGAWPWDARCSCGWETRTGGATEVSIRREVRDHRIDVELGLL